MSIGIISGKEGVKPRLSVLIPKNNRRAEVRAICPKAFCGGNAAIFVFPVTCAAEKHLVSEKPFIQRFFKDTGVVLAGIECSPKIRDFRASGIPVQERVDFFDTLRAPDRQL